MVTTIQGGRLGAFWKLKLLIGKLNVNLKDVSVRMVMFNFTVFMHALNLTIVPHL